MIERISPSLSTACCAVNRRAWMPRARLPAPACSEAAASTSPPCWATSPPRPRATLRNAEALSIAGVRGQASVQQVVDAVMTAEQSLQTAIAVRDKVVSAYLEISRMAI